MIPLILIATDVAKVDTYIEEFVKKEQILPYAIFKIIPPKNEITIDQVRDVKYALLTQSKTKRLFIFYEFHNASIEVQNALLKTLEEKTEQNQFILISQTEQTILPTIKSRSKIVSLNSNESIHVIRPEASSLLNELLKNDHYTFLNDPLVAGISKDNASLLIDEIILYFRNLFGQSPTSSVMIIKKALELKNLLTNNNLNPPMVIDNLLIFVKKSSKIKLP